MDNKEELSEFLKVNMPEVLKGMNINFGEYVPAGGFAWQRKYREEYRKEISDKIECLNRELSIANMAKSDISAAYRNINVMKDSLASLEHLITFHGMDRKADFDVVAKHIKSLESCIEGFGSDETETKIVENTVAVLTGLRELIEQDAQYDLMMWALHIADVKYRTKIFREAYRKYVVLTGIINLIEIKSEGVNDTTVAKFGEPFAELVKAYKNMVEPMRVTKKGLSARGNEFWRVNDDPIVDKQMRTECSVGAGEWRIV